MTYKYPTTSTGYGMNNLAAAKTINAAAAKNNAAAAKMPAPSWSTSGTSAYTALTGKPTSAASTGYGQSSATAAKTINALAQRAAAPVTSAPVRSSASMPAPSWQMPAPSWSTAGSNGVSAAQAASGRAPSSNLQMPSGFASGALGASPTHPAAAAPNRLSASGQQIANAHQPPPMAASGGIQYYDTVQKQTAPGAGAAPPPFKTGVTGPATKTATDQFGRTFSYNEGNTNAVNQPVAGISANGTVLKTVISGNGQPYTYDTGIQAFTAPPTRPAAPKAPPPIVGRPTQTGQPVSTPVINTAPPPRQPTQDEIDSANQGRWLG